MNYTNIGLIIANSLLIIFSFGVGIFSIIKNSKSNVVRWWFLMNIAVGLWAIGYLLLMLSKGEQEALFYSKLL